ncbi:MAG TPA: VIT domain-containing protein [Coleofasciculaceae cyanobacterium]
MKQACPFPRPNRFTRWFLFALVLLAASLFLYVGKALAQKADPTKSAPETAIERVTIFPDRIIMPPQADASVALEGYSVETSIRDNLATTTITQTYKNNSSRTLEARYLFPLPADANFSSFTLTVNGKALEGRILEKNEARNTYQEIVRRLIDPGLLEYIDDRTVQASIAPFFAGETKKIQLSYTQLLQRDGGLYKYSYYLGSQAPGTINQPVPMHGITRAEDIRCIRYPCHPAAPSAPAPSLDLNLDIHTAQALKTVYSPTHDPKINREGAQKAAVKLTVKPQDVQKEKNFVLYFSQDNDAITLNTLNYQKAGEDGYFLMTVRTPENIKTEVLPKDVVLVLDTSGSMSGDKIRQAKEALKTIISRLRPEDRFGLLQFNTDVSAFKNELVPANAANKQSALDYVQTLEASGSTHIEAALKEGFAQLKNHEAKRPAYVIFLTDGEPTVGITDTEGLVQVAEKANTYDARLFSFGVGYDLNALLLGKLSDNNHGSATFVEPNENLELAVTGFYKKIEAPVLTDAKLDFSGLQVKKQYPDTLNDLFAGSEVVLLGRYTGPGGGTLKLTGKVGSETKNFEYPVRWETSTAHNQLPRLWAGRRIAYLLDSIRQHGENTELKDEVVALSKQYGIITPYTSFLAQEPDDSRRQAANGFMSSGGSMLAPAAPMASRTAMDASSGQGAVQFSKRLGAMKAQSSASALNAAQAPAAESAEGIASPTLKTIGTKTFTLSKEGVWADTAYDEKTHGKPQAITFGTDDYFQLLAAKPELLPYFSLGEQVLVVLMESDGHWKAYQVLPAKTS